MAEQLLHENFMAQASEECSITGIILKCCLENATPIYCSNRYFFLLLLLSFGQNPWLHSSNEFFVLSDLFLGLKGSVQPPFSFFPSLSANCLLEANWCSGGPRIHPPIMSIHAPGNGTASARSFYPRLHMRMA